MDKSKALHLWFLTAWFGATFTCLIFSVLFFFYISTPKVVLPTVQSFKLYAALPGSNSSVSTDIKISDARARIIDDFFKSYKSPLASYGDIFVSVSDKYKLDYRLLPSIAMQESNGGKRVIGKSYNP